MSASSSRAVYGLLTSKYLLSAAAALMLAACSDSMDRFAANPSDSDPVYTASVPKQKLVAQADAGTSDDAIVSRPLANASVKPPAYNYTYKKTATGPVYKQPALTRSAATPHVPQVADAAEPTVETPSVPAGSAVTVGNGMTLYSIARANNLTVAELAAANHIKPPYAVHSGQVIRVPGSGHAALPEAAPAKRVAAAAPFRPAIPQPHLQKSAAASHEVGSGDTLFSLGRQYGVSPYVIADANGLDHNAQLHLGQKVKIPGASATPIAMKTPEKVMAKPKAVAAATEEQGVATPAPAPVKTAEATIAIPKTVDTQQAAPEAQPQQMADAQPADNSAGGMRWPVRGKVISNFGAKPNGLKNEGINISVPEGTSIRAAEGGVVAYAGNELKGYGNLVLIRHEGGYVTAYAHAKELFVKRGDTVKRGDVIAKAGQTGSVSSPQLHFEVRKGATALDPLKYLGASTAMN